MYLNIEHVFYKRPTLNKDIITAPKTYAISHRRRISLMSTTGDDTRAVTSHCQ